MSSARVSDPAAVEFRPRFVLWTAVLAQIPYQLFFTVWAGGFFGTLLQSMAPGLTAGASPQVGVGALVFLVFPFVTLTLKRFNYDSTTYSIFPDRLVIEEGFLTQHHKEIGLPDVREFNLRRGVLQRAVGLGSVYVATQATGTGQPWTSLSVLGSSSTFGSGAMLRDLDQAGEAYALLTRLKSARA